MEPPHSRTRCNGCLLSLLPSPHKVAPDGTYSKPPMTKIAYGTLVQVRSGFVILVAKALAKAVTIATRYSVVRRQGESEIG